MRRTLFLLILLLAWLGAEAQQPAPTITIDGLKRHDLSPLWIGAIPLIDRDDTTTIDWVERWEPIGYIGRDYRRFYLHIDRVCRDPQDRLRYLIRGKTRVGDNICPFEGEITIDSATPSEEKEAWGGKVSSYRLSGHYTLREDPEATGAGVLQGTHTFSLAADATGNIYYDTLNLEADGYSNNQWEGVWSSYKTGALKPCNWGDFRIPDSGRLDIGAAEFSPAEEYVTNGWQNYNAMLNGDQKALEEERRKWWAD